MKNLHVTPIFSTVIPAKAGIHNRINKAQSTLEFTFAMVVIMFLIYGMVQIFRWAGMDLANRRWAQDSSLTNFAGTDPSSELDSNAADVVLPMSAVWHGSITNASQ